MPNDEFLKKRHWLVVYSYEQYESYYGSTFWSKKNIIISINAKTLNDLLPMSKFISAADFLDPLFFPLAYATKEIWSDIKKEKIYVKDKKDISIIFFKEISKASLFAFLK